MGRAGDSDIARQPRKPLPDVASAAGAFFWLARAVEQGCADEGAALIYVTVP